jgi:hypothetical protein
MFEGSDITAASNRTPREPALIGRLAPEKRTVNQVDVDSGTVAQLRLCPR